MKISEGFLKQIQLALYCIFAWSGFISTSVACDAALQNELLSEYVTGYHDFWGEQSPRDLVDAILDEFSIKAINILENSNSSGCRFSQEIKRSPPNPKSSGITLDRNAVVIDVMFEFVFEQKSFCVGLNNIDKIGLPPDHRYPHQIRRVGNTPLVFHSLHYAMKCFAMNGESTRYVYY